MSSALDFLTSAVQSIATSDVAIQVYITAIQRLQNEVEAAYKRGDIVYVEYGITAIDALLIEAQRALPGEKYALVFKAAQAAIWSMRIMIWKAKYGTYALIGGLGLVGLLVWRYRKK